jgi:hypothetical protein
MAPIQHSPQKRRKASTIEPTETARGPTGDPPVVPIRHPTTHAKPPASRPRAAQHVLIRLARPMDLSYNSSICHAR